MLGEPVKDRRFDLFERADGFRDGLHGLRPHVDAGVLGVVALPSCAAPGEDELPLPLALGALVANVVGVVVPAWPSGTFGCPPPTCHIRGLYMFSVRILR